EYLELAYATTAYGVQGETVAVAHVAVGTHTSASSAYVGMSRGRDRNIAHLVADSIDDARKQWVQVFSRDRADLGPAHAARRAAEDLERDGSMYVGRSRNGVPRRAVGIRPVRPEVTISRPASSPSQQGSGIGM
ncbi:MAG: MobF family relaxase, partial [Rubrobacteraceae bacterium]